MFQCLAMRECHLPVEVINFRSKKLCYDIVWHGMPGAQCTWAGRQWGRTLWNKNLWGRTSLGQDVSRAGGSGAGSRESHSLGPQFHVQNYNLNLTETSYSPQIPALVEFWLSMIRI